MEKLMNDYESVLVASLKGGEEGAQKVVDYFKGVIERHATLAGVDVWGKRALAYDIMKESEGYYVLFTFNSDRDFPRELERRYGITDGVLRWLVIKKEENAAKSVSIEKTEA